MTPHTLALLLILCPPQDPTPVWEADPGSYQGLKDVGHLLELCDRTQGSWGSYTSDLPWLQRAIRRVQGTPSLWHVGRLPPKEVVDRAATFAGQHLDWLEHQQLAYPYRNWEPWLQAAGRHKHFWHSAACAVQQSNSDLAYRREALGAMRDLLGEPAWDAGAVACARASRLLAGGVAADAGPGGVADLSEVSNVPLPTADRRAGPGERAASEREAAGAGGRNPNRALSLVLAHAARDPDAHRSGVVVRVR